MADIIIKNKNGTPITYMGKTKIKCNTADGGTVVFTEGGTSVEILPAPGFTLVPGTADVNGWYPNPRVGFTNIPTIMQLYEGLTAEGGYLPCDEILVRLSDEALASANTSDSSDDSQSTYFEAFLTRETTIQGLSLDLVVYGDEGGGGAVYVAGLLKSGFMGPRWQLVQIAQSGATWALYLVKASFKAGVSFDVWVKARKGIIGISENEKHAKWNFSSLRTADNTLVCMSIVDGETGLAFPATMAQLNAAGSISDVLDAMRALSTTKSVFTATPGVAVPTEADAKDASTHIYQVMALSKSGDKACLWKDCEYEKHGHAIFVDGHGAFKAVTSETAAKKLPMPTLAGFAAWPEDYGTEPTERNVFIVFSGIAGRIVKKDATGDGLAGLVAQMKTEYAASAEEFKMIYGDFPISASAREIDTTLTYLASDAATATITEEDMQS